MDQTPIHQLRAIKKLGFNNYGLKTSFAILPNFCGDCNNPLEGFLLNKFFFHGSYLQGTSTSFFGDVFVHFLLVTSKNGNTYHTIHGTGI